jgi:alpha-tubulin suppressor-like RCC1 family protein
VADKAFCWGYGQEGQRGDGATTEVSRAPVAVTGGLLFGQITAGSLHTCGVTTSGVSYCWGMNSNGELGDRSKTNRSTPVQVFGGISFRQLSAGQSFTCGVSTGNIAYCWGINLTSRLGSDPDFPRRLKPTPVDGGLRFDHVTAGLDQACGVATSGPAWCWGFNFYGQLGDGTTTTRPAPVAVSGTRSWTEVRTGGNHTCGITGAGKTFCWGLNGSGQLGNGNTSDASTPVAVKAPTS